MRIAIVVSRFNDFVTDRLLAGAQEALREHGLADADVEVLRVPGAFEIPMAAQRVAETGRVSRRRLSRCLIKGATPHFEYIASACAHGITAAAAATGVPMAFGVLTTNSVEEALERAVPGEGNKGREAALAALEMARLFETLGDSRHDHARCGLAMGRPAPRARSGAADALSDRSRPAVGADVARTHEPIGGERCHRRSTTRRATYAIALAPGAWDDRETLDGYIADAARNWRVERLAVVDRLLLRLGVHELLAHPDTPPRVVIDEAIELARAYSGDEAAKFVNGVLDGVFQAAERRRESDRVSPVFSCSSKARAVTGTETDELTHASMSNEATVNQRRANLEAITSSAFVRTRTALRPTRHRDRAGRGARRAHEGGARSDARRDGHRRPHHQHPQLRQGQLLRALRRAQPDSGVRPAGRAQRARLRAVEAARLRRSHRRRRPSVPHQDQRAVDLGVARSSSSPSASSRCRRSGTACRMSRFATASAISISSSIPTCGACSKCAAGRSRRFASSSSAAGFSKSRRR